MTVDAVETRGPHLAPRFAPEMERAFQDRYYANIHNTLRIVAAVLALLFLVYAGRDYSDTRSLSLAARQNGAPAVFFLILFGLTFWRGFGRVWQPVTVLGGLAAAAISLGGQAAFFGQGLARGVLPNPAAESPFPGHLLFYSLHACTLMVCFAALQLPFRWVLGLQIGVLAAGVWAFATWLLGGRPDPASALSRFLQPTLLVLFVVLLAAWVQERLSRNAFVANYLLDRERSDERRKRERTEAMLQVLSQAIGGVVHDLGNPLTSVQTGAETLEMFIEGGNTDRALLQEFTGMIQDGARMLNYLRLSLMEQTRVLEGKPIPVERKPTSVRRMIEAGARYQKPKFAGGRRIVLDGEDLEVSVDEMKLITVFMNLIGNALKYSDGEVRIAWRTHDNTLLIAILDQGVSGKGITEAQARQLFVAFGRLDAHAEVEGTGLGLLSVRKIVEAHGGEIFIEGHKDGTPGSAVFRTAQGTHPSLLAGDFRTAFVVACPLASAS